MAPLKSVLFIWAVVALALVVSKVNKVGETDTDIRVVQNNFWYEYTHILIRIKGISNVLYALKELNMYL